MPLARSGIRIPPLAPRVAALALGLGLLAALARDPRSAPARASIADQAGHPNARIEAGEALPVWDAVADAPAPSLGEPAFRDWYASVVANIESSATPAQEESPFTTIDACVIADMAEARAHGASIAILDRGELVHVRGYGHKHPEREALVDAETLFRIGSTTKMMTAAGVMQLVEDGTVDLDAPVTRYVPDFRVAPPWRAAAITTRQLLTHSAGIPDATEDPFVPTPLAEWVAQRAPIQLYAPPGSFFNYSNPSWSLAGLVLQAASGEPYRTRLVEKVWRPAGMLRTTMDPATVIADGNYSFGGSNGQAIPPDGYDSLWGGPAGFAFSTPSELVAWAKLLMDGGGDVLADESASAMQAMQIGSDARPGLGYGFGIFRNEELPGLTLLEHGGNIEGWSSQLFWIPEREFAVSLLATSGSSLSNAARCAILETVQPEPPAPVDLSTAPETWDAYEGTYVLQDPHGRQTTAWIDRNGDTLRLQLGHALDLPLAQLYLDTFQQDLDGDGVGDGDTMAFIAHPERPERAEWIRNRGFVGIRAGLFPQEIAMRGTACATFHFTSHMSMPAPLARGWGLDNVVVTREAVAASADDPEDPASASFKLDLHAEEAVAAIEARIHGQADDDLDLFLLHDADGDARFAYPDEVVGRSATATSNELIEVGGVEPLPAGDYQLWVQGWQVEGADSTFDLDVLMILGEGLRIEGLPGTITAGEDVAARICADPVVIADADGPRRGSIVLATGGAPRHVVVPVRWTPDDRPDPQPTPPVDKETLYLPWLNR